MDLNDHRTGLELIPSASLVFDARNSLSKRRQSFQQEFFTTSLLEYICILLSPKDIALAQRNFKGNL